MSSMRCVETGPPVLNHASCGGERAIRTRDGMNALDQLVNMWEFFLLLTPAGKNVPVLQ
jgi:hypothetical protein